MGRMLTWQIRPRILLLCYNLYPSCYWLLVQKLVIFLNHYFKIYDIDTCSKQHIKCKKWELGGSFPNFLCQFLVYSCCSFLGIFKYICVCVSALFIYIYTNERYSLYHFSTCFSIEQFIFDIFSCQHIQICFIFYQPYVIPLYG